MVLSFLKDNGMLSFFSKPKAPLWKIQLWYAPNPVVSVERVTILWHGFRIGTNDFSEGKSQAPGKEVSWPQRGASRCISHWCKAAYKVLTSNCVGRPSGNLTLVAGSHGSEVPCTQQMLKSTNLKHLSKYWVNHATGIKNNMPSFSFSVILQHYFIFQESTRMKLYLVHQSLPELKKW